MKIDKVVLIQVAMVGICATASFWMADRLPSEVPIHWVGNNQPDKWGSPDGALWFGPLLTAVVLCITLIARILPKGKDAIQNDDAFGSTFLLLSGMGTFYHLYILRMTAYETNPRGSSWAASGTTTAIVILGGLILFMGAIISLAVKAAKQASEIKPNP